MKVFIFMDYQSFDCELKSNDISEINYKALVDYLAKESENRYLMNGYAYFAINPRAVNEHNREIEELRDLGFQINKKVGIKKDYTYSCNLETEMTLDMTSVAYSMNPDIMVLISNNPNLVPLVVHLKRRGIRVEVASFMDSDLSIVASDFINLSLALEEENGEVSEDIMIDNQIEKGEY